MPALLANKLDRMWKIVFFALLCATASASEDVAVIVDPNASGVTERKNDSVITSVCTIVSLPNLDIKDRLVFGEKVGAAIIGNSTLIATGQGVGDKIEPRTHFGSQMFAIFSLAPFSKLEQITLPGFVCSYDALYPELKTYFKGTAGAAYALMYNASGTGQNIVQVNTKGLTVNAYTVPNDEVQFTDFFPLTEGYILLHILPLGNGIESKLELLDIKQSKIGATFDVQPHIRNMFHNVRPSNSYLATIAEADPHVPQDIALITWDGKSISFDRRRLPISYDWRTEGVVKGITTKEGYALVGVGSGPQIKYLYSVDFAGGEALKVLTFDSQPQNFAVSSDGKYLVTVSRNNPQVCVYDLSTFKLLNKKDSIGYNPIFIETN